MMARSLLLLFVILAVTVVQTTFADLLAVGRVKPDFVLALAVYFALHYDIREAVLPVWALGIIRDAYSLGPMGLYALLFLLAGLLISYIRSYAFRDNILIVIATTVLALFFVEVAAAAVLSAHYAMPPVGWILMMSLLTGLYTSVPVLLFPRLLNRPLKWVGLGRVGPTT